MIQIIDYGAGNIKSVQNALKQLGVESKTITSGQELEADCKTIFPGVGAAGNAMRKLKEKDFLEKIPQIKAPFLGICLGMQLLVEYSEEDETKCLGIIKGKALEFPKTVKIPQIGWNKVKQTNRQDPLFKDVPDQSYFYFVNSYYVDRCEEELGTTDYGRTFVPILKKDNFYGTQFHPEKSGEIGLKLLNNFCELC